MHVSLEFVPCHKSNKNDCASITEINQFLKKHDFWFVNVENFIEMGEIEPLEDTVKSIADELLLTKIDIEDPSTYVVRLSEHRNSLQDSTINFMNLAVAK